MTFNHQFIFIYFVKSNKTSILQQILHCLAEQKWKTTYSEEVRNLARNGITYLDERSKFWHQEKPVYARMKAGRLKPLIKPQLTKNQRCPEINKVLNRLHHIDKCKS